MSGLPVPCVSCYLRLELVVLSLSVLLLVSFTELLLFRGEVAVLLLLLLLLLSLAVLLLWVAVVLLCDAVLLLTSAELELLLLPVLRLALVPVALVLRLVTGAAMLLLSADERFSRAADAFLSGTVAVSLREVSLPTVAAGLVSDEFLV
jgi:hypothetical protein